MKKQNYPSLALVVLSVAALSSCADHKRREPDRYVKESSAINATSSEPLKSLTGSLDATKIPSACERLDQLASEAANASSRFSYIGKIFAYRGEFTGMIDISESPFTQFILGEKFKVDDFDAFYAKAKAEYEAGKVSGMKWFMLNTMKNLGMGQKAQFSATNGKLEEKFPGIFGSSGKLDDSMHFQLAKRLTKVESLDEKAVAAILSKKIPLFPGDGGWASHAENTGLSLASSVKAMRGESGQEKLCALVLLHQNFAQLLRSKGHRAPVHVSSRGPVSSRMEKLSASNPEFPVNELSGAFFDLGAKKSILLENESISEYNPEKKILSVGAKVPSGTAVGEAGALVDSLAFMEAMLYSFEASSPAADGITEANYLFGDVSAEAGAAVLPAEAHSLSLGLFTMQMKNLAGLHIKKINARGLALREGEPAAGIALVSEAGRGQEGKVRLAELVRFAKVTSYFENALKRLVKRSPEQLEKLNPVYKKATLAALLGKAMFSEEELAKLLTEEQRKTVLRDSLLMLKLPLAVLMSQMGTGKQGCVAEVQWNFETGERRPLAPCSKELKLDLANVFEVMARDSNSPLLMQKAEELRK